MNERTLLRFAGYRFRTTFWGRRGGYLALLLLVGLVGGVAMGSIAAARRTQSSFPTFLASTNPSDMSLGTALYNPSLGYDTGYNARLVHTISQLPHVKRANSFAGLNAYQLQSDGSPNTVINDNVVGSVDGEYFTQDRVKVVRGRMANPNRADEMVMSAGAARLFGLRVGQAAPWAIYPSSASNAPSGPARRLKLRLVGIVVFNDAIVQDQVDRTSAPHSVVLTPTLTRAVVDCCSNYAFTYLQLDHGSDSVPAVESEIQRVLPPGIPFDAHATSVTLAKAQRAIKPEAIALAVFGGIAALAALLIAAQVIARQVRLVAPEGDTLRALGAAPAMTMCDDLIGVLMAVVVGSLLAAAVAVALSPLAPIGPARPVDPTSGISFDWTVLGLGVLVLVISLGAVAVALSYRAAPHRVTHPASRGKHESHLADALAGAGVPAPAVTGIRFALQPGSGRDPVPVRSAILGAVLAMIVVIATVVFGASLNNLVSHPELYGWNWTYELSGGGGVGDIPQQQSARLLNHDPHVAGWAGYYFGTLQVDGRSVPVLGGTPNSRVGPPVLSGHGLAAADEVVLGDSTLAELHKHVGDTVAVAFGDQRPIRLRIVGTATMPTVGISGVDTNHLSMGTGALLSYRLIPESVWNSFGNVPPGPNVIFVRAQNGIAPSALKHTLVQTANTLTLPTNYGVSVVPVQLPAEIINYRSMASTPVYLGIALAAGTVVALGLTLVASVRRRRRDLALLKTLGFTEGQLAASVAWQASVAVAIGVVVGVPLGIALGRILWFLFARQVDAVPATSVPFLPLVLIAVGAILLANLVAAIPGRIAARTPTALLLRAE